MNYRIPISSQITAVQLHILGLRNQIERAHAKEIKRTPEQIERVEQLKADCEAAVRTLEFVERHHDEIIQIAKERGWK